ncbi:PREDICTED: nuclear pore complex protein DDB_G0274915-like [Nicrophorus vespilloides]|uniref:Nucleoporin NUP42 n=1 Tax=Nicrophorus vespilloides TaxID=110193 RepID=A0ABM1M2U8_NICVS|nr:PREDICTED: nuclear pore complex protein DDB_G0274915-like [Nicrophorus vespilloides]
MVVCKFFLQGTCKFGANCRFEHPVNQQPNNGGQAAITDLNTLIRAVQGDMSNAEKGGQWVLTCYAPFKEKPMFPGFEDMSYEEVRVGFYEATKSGTLDAYKQQLQGLLQAALQKIRALQNPSADLVNLLKDIYNSPVAGSFQGGTNVSSNSNVFGGAPQEKKGFGACPPYSSPFGGSAASNSPFGGGGAQQNPFGAQSGQYNNAQSGLFGAAVPSNSPFGGAAATPGPSGPFGGTTAQGANGPFGAAVPATGNVAFGQAASSPFGAQVANPFGGQAATGNSPFGAAQSAAGNSPFRAQQSATSNPFGAPQAANPFGAPQQQSPFGMIAANSPFGVQQPVATSNSVFGAVQQPVAASNSLFGPAQHPVATNNSMFGAAQQPVATSNSLFGAVQQPIAPSNSLFGAAPPGNNVFGTFGQPSTFGASSPPFGGQQQQQQQQQPFGGQTSNFAVEQKSSYGQPVAQMQNSPFGGPPPQTAQSNSIFGGGVAQQQVAIDAHFYSKREELSEAELAAFQSSAFEFGKIPEHPPPSEMCI